MTSTWWRMSRWTVGSSRTMIGAAWATASAMRTSWRSPSESSRTSRPSEMAHADPLDGRRDGRAIGGSRAADRVLMRQPAQRDDLLDARRERQHRLLRDDRQATRDAPSIQSGDRLAAQPHLTDDRLRHPGHGAQQRRLAGAVGPDHGDPLARRHLQVDVAKDGPADGSATVTPTQLDHSSYPVRVRRSRNRKNGAPMTAVTTPTGISPSSRATTSA